MNHCLNGIESLRGATVPNGLPDLLAMGLWVTADRGSSPSLLAVAGRNSPPPGGGRTRDRSGASPGLLGEGAVDK